MGHNSLTPQGRAPDYGLLFLRWAFLARLCLHLSYPFQYGPFTLCLGSPVQVAFRSFSEEIIPYVAVEMLCLWEKVSSRSLYCALL